MARRLINVSGETRTLQDHTGRWHVIPPDGVLVVDDADQREYPAVTWAEAPAAPTKTSKTKEA